MSAEVAHGRERRGSRARRPATQGVDRATPGRRGPALLRLVPVGGPGDEPVRRRRRAGAARPSPAPTRGAAPAGRRGSARVARSTSFGGLARPSAREAPGRNPPWVSNAHTRREGSRLRGGGRAGGRSHGRSSRGELMRIQEAERAGAAVRALPRTRGRAARARDLGPERSRVTIGRADGCELRVGWDERVSRTHAVIERVGDDWVVAGRRALAQRHVRERVARIADAAAAGRARRHARRAHLMLFHAPPAGHGRAHRGRASRTCLGADDITTAQRRVLRALARPSLEARELAAPATERAHRPGAPPERGGGQGAPAPALPAGSGSRTCRRSRSASGWCELAVEGGLAGEASRREPEPPTPTPT